MPTRRKPRNATSTDWEPIVDVCFPKELYIHVLIEEAERELLEEARQMTRDLMAPPSFTQH